MHFDDLRIYNIAFELEIKLFQLVRGVSGYQHSKLINQVNRSASSVSANIVEGWSRRSYPKDFIRFLYIALGSSDETQHHIRVLYNRGCLKKDDYESLRRSYQNLSVRILNYINFLKNKHKIYKLL